MKNSRERSIFVGMCFFVMLVTAGCHVNQFSERTDAVHSPDGSVRSGDIALSPDGNYYASYDSTLPVEFGVYQNNGELVTALPKVPNNDIKAYCWSTNSKLLAVMYHDGDEHGVFILDAMNGQQYFLYLVMKTPPDALDRVPIDDYYHFLVFEKGYNNQLLAAISVNGNPGPAVRLDQFEIIDDIKDPRITLEPPNPISVEVGQPYVEPGVFAFDEFDGPLAVKDDADTAVDTSILGTYIITYTVEDLSGNVATTTRTVYVVDSTPPVVSIIGSDPINLNVDDVFNDPGATAMDNYDGVLMPESDAGQAVDTSTPGVYIVTYVAIDSSGNIGMATREVIVTDITPPTITLLGSNPLYSPIGDVLIDPGATAIDNADGDVLVTSDWDTVVDVNIADIYVVTYSASDAAGNTVTITREVRIEEFGIIYTVVPEYGSNTNLRGRVTGLRPEDAANVLTATTILVEGNWWTKPFAVESGRTRIVNPDGTWVCDVTTGGNDRFATKYITHVVPAGFVPPLCLPCSQMPDYPESLGSVVVDRTPPAITMSVFGYDWEVKHTDFRAGPGPNYFSSENVSIDEFGRVHLAIKFDDVDNRWETSEIIGLDSFGYKTYVVETTGRLDILDPNVVFAPMFTWEDESLLPGHREIDALEVALWGIAGGDPVGTNSQNVIHPCNACPGCGVDKCNRYTINLTESEQDVTVYMVWTPGQVEFRTYLGHHLGSVPPASSLINLWVTNSSDIPDPGNEKIHMNFWLRNGLAPIDGLDNEMIINNFAVFDNPPAWDNTPPQITILGDNPATTEAKEAYVDAGVIAIDDVDGDITDQVKVTSTVNIDVLGEDYTVTYEVTDSSNNTATEVRTVRVTDTTPPTIILVDGNVTLEVHDSYEEPGYTASDTLDGDLTDQVTVSSTVQ